MTPEPQFPIIIFSPPLLPEFIFPRIPPAGVPGAVGTLSRSAWRIFPRESSTVNHLKMNQEKKEEKIKNKEALLSYDSFRV